MHLLIFTYGSGDLASLFDVLGVHNSSFIDALAVPIKSGVSNLKIAINW